MVNAGEHSRRRPRRRPRPVADANGKKIHYQERTTKYKTCTSRKSTFPIRSLKEYKRKVDELNRMTKRKKVY